MEETVVSKDGTSIAYRVAGNGPALILVGGGLDDGSENIPLAMELAKRFTVDNYARRGRGASGDRAPYAMAREIEDIEALILESGGTAHVFGVSSGGALALEAVMAGAAAAQLAVYEVPYDLAEETPELQRHYTEELSKLLAEGRRSDALQLFMRMAGSTDDDIAEARESAFWASLEKLAPTLAYDAECLGDRKPPLRGLAVLGVRVLVITGGGFPPFEAAADAMAEAIPAGTRLVLADQGHVADPTVLAEALGSFFGHV
jgi:pimeloyl-ACP methyl ester carboxylesterase